MSTPSGYILYPIEVDSTELLDEAYQLIKSKSPNWQQNDANLDVWIMQATAAQAADLLSLANNVPESIFQYYGSSIVGIPPNDGASALVGSTWTMSDSLGHTIPAGTQVSIRDSAGVEHGFESTADVVIPAGSTATAAGGITLQSVEVGASLNNLGGAGYAATLIDTLAYVSSVVLTGPTAGGGDPELSSEYSDRLARKLQRLSQRPVLAADYSLAALDVAGVYRSLALDGYNSSNQTYNNERYLGIAAVDSAGVPISAGIKTNLQTYLDGLRETNFVVNVFDPTVSLINVTYNVKCLTGYTTAVVKTNADAQVNNYLSSANWGQDPSVLDSSARLQTWVQTTQLLYNKLIQVLGNTEGVNYVISMTMAIQGNTLGTADITLPGAAPLTKPNTITGTATP